MTIHRNQRPTLLGLFLLLTIWLAGCRDLAREPAAAGVDARVETNLAAHVDGPAITRWYRSLPAGSLEHDAARWILAWLPLSDLVSLDLPLLQEHVNLACATYRAAPWHDRLPRETWLQFVVPHRVSQEPLEPWRSELARRLAPVIAPYDNMEDAALAVNRWCREQATYISTSGRDMGPLTTMKRGLGRCEEEMILTICALRAAGLPARTCSTPYWSFTDDNHAWVEVWADGSWYYAESCDDRRCLNDAWFSGAASRAGFVQSVGYGEFRPATEQVYRSGDGVTLVNSTRVYTDPFVLSATVKGRPGAEVQVNVLNYGTLRAIAKLAAGVHLEMGPGSYALTATGADGGLLLRTVSGQPGDEIAVELDPRTDLYDTELSPGFWLTYPEAGARPRRQEVRVGDDVDRHHRLLVAADQAEREKLRELSPLETAILDSLPADLRNLWDTEILTRPCESFAPLVRLVTWYRTPAQREALTWLLADSDDKDLLELDEAVLRSHVDLALAARGDLPPEIWREGLLALRIHKEPGGDWRENLPLLDTPTSAGVLARFREATTRVESTYFGNPLPPHHTWQLGRGTETDLKVAFVGLCRRNGVAARYRHGKVEVWDGAWREVDPLPSGDADEQTRPVSGTGWLDIQLTRGGVPWPEAESYRNFMVSRAEQGRLVSPWWDPIVGLQVWDAGEFWFCATVRVPGGSAHGRLTRFAVAPAETTVVTLPVDIDDHGWDPSNLVDADLGATLVLPSSLPAAGLYFIFEPGEPATRMIPLLGRLRARLESRDLPLVPVMVGNEPQAVWREKLAAAELPPRLYDETDSALGAWLADRAHHGPVIVLVLPGRTKPVLLKSGLDGSVDQTVHLALDMNRP